MNSAEEKLQELRKRAERRRSDYNDAVSRARTMKEFHDRDLKALKDQFNVESVEEADAMILKQERELMDRLAQLEGRLR